MADIKIYQGNQIGGCITVISSASSKIVIDFGENLPGSKRIENIEFDWEKEKIDAVFFTHYHGDHIGRFMEIPDDVDLYMGEVTYKVMLNIRKAIHDDEAVNKLIERFNDGKITFIERNEPIMISDDMIVTGYEVDHSAYDAYMFLVEADGTNILHTGDYRDHGHRGHVIKNGKDQNILLDVIKYYILKNKKRKVDILITEGTMMGDRADEEYFSEKQLKAWATEYFKEHRHVFLKISSTNVDSLASFYQAAKQNGITMYTNSYIRKQFTVYRNAGRKHGTQMYDFLGTKLFPFISKEPDADNSKAMEAIEEMKENGFVAIVGEYDYYERTMDALMDTNPQMIYSMWEGYINPDSPAYDESLAQFCNKYNSFTKHTSGHAYKSVIEQVIEAVNPTQCIWPIHTENAEGFKELNISEGLKRKVKSDG